MTNLPCLAQTLGLQFHWWPPGVSGVPRAAVLREALSALLQSCINEVRAAVLASPALPHLVMILAGALLP